MPYLRQAVVNRARSVLRHRAVIDRHPPVPPPDDPSAETVALTVMGDSSVTRAVLALPQRQRQAILLRYYAGFSYAEIAAELGISTGTLKNHIARGTSALRSLLRDEAA